MAVNTEPPIQLHPNLSYGDLVAFINENFRKLSDNLNGKNPYKFSAYRSANVNVNDTTSYDVVFDTELYDTNNNFDTTTGKYTVPVTGYYYIAASTKIMTNNEGSGGNRYLWETKVQLSDGTTVLDESRLYVYADGRFTSITDKLGKLHYLTAGTTLKVTTWADTNDSTNYVLASGRQYTHFSGFLVSK